MAVDAAAVLAQHGRATRHEVLAVRYATLRSTKHDLYYRYQAYGDPDAEVEMAYYFWVLRSAAQTIVIDTGFAAAAGARRGRTTVVEPVAALGALGVDPASVTTLIITHLHYDHIGNVGAFPNATLVVPRRELDFWTGPLASRVQFGSHVEADEVAAIDAAHRAGRVRLTDGVEQLADGVTAVCVGGHSPGQQVTVVAAEGGDVVLTSDAVHFYEELELDRPFAVIADLGEMYAAFDLLRELGGAPGAVLVPGHDPAVLERFPAVDANTVRVG